MTQTTPDTTGVIATIRATPRPVRYLLDGVVTDQTSVVRRRVAGVAGGVGTGRLTSS